MAQVWNVAGSAGVEPKKITSKLSFDIGDVFLAKIVNKDDSGEMVEVRTVDGWKFQAKLDKPLDQVPDELVRFQVQGMENGVLTLKAFDKPDSSSKKIEQDIGNILKQLNIDFNKDDLSLFMKMIKFNMPLTKENIAEIKSLIDFQSKIKQDEGEEQGFILKYLSKNNIDIDSEEGKNIQTALKDFFASLKTLSQEDILTLKENGVELTKDNIDSYKRIIDNDNVIFDDIKELNGCIGKDSETINNTSVKDIFSLMENIHTDIKSIVSSLIKNEEKGGKLLQNLSEGSEDEKFINYVSQKIEDVVSELMDDGLQKLKSYLTDMKQAGTLQSEVIPDSAVTIKSEVIADSAEATKSEVMSESIQEAAVTSESKVEPELTVTPKSSEVSKSTEFLKAVNTFTENFKLDITKALNSKSKGLAEEILTKLDSAEQEPQKINEFSKLLTDKISESMDKAVNNFFGELTGTADVKQDTSKVVQIKSYIADLLNKEFDSIKEFDKSNAKTVIKFAEFKNETVNKVSKFLEFSYLIKDKNGAPAEIAKAGEELKNNIAESAQKEMGSVQLKNNISKVIDELIKSITDTIDDPKQQNPGAIKNAQENIESVKKEFIEKNRELITDIKDFLQQKSTIKPEQYSKVIEQLKSNINDFKVYNSLSNNYYLLDIPVNISDKQYNCKLMIKDDRKNGKKIDSKDVKFVVSVGTLNMGIIDAFINVKNDNMKLDIKSDSKWIRLLNSERNTLIDSLKRMGYNVYLNFSEKKIQANLSECREFFNDFSFNMLDTKV